MSVCGGSLRNERIGSMFFLGQCGQCGMVRMADGRCHFAVAADQTGNGGIGHFQFHFSIFGALSTVFDLLSAPIDT